MIVDRWTFDIKQGRMSDAVALFREDEAQEREHGYTGAYRIYVSSIGVGGRLAVEWEHESLAEYEQAMARFGARPGTQAWMERFREVSKGGGLHEIWRVPD